MESEDLLITTLEVAVPLWINKIKVSGTLHLRLAHRRKELSNIIASKGDIILYKSKKSGETAKAFNALAEALAIMSFIPGGVTFKGKKWETKE